MPPMSMYLAAVDTPEGTAEELDRIRRDGARQYHDGPSIHVEARHESGHGRTGSLWDSKPWR